MTSVALSPSRTDTIVLFSGLENRSNQFQNLIRFLFRQSEHRYQTYIRRVEIKYWSRYLTVYVYAEILEYCGTVIISSDI